MDRKILILTESFDNTADKVCYWLNYFGQSFFRVNTDLDSIWVHEVEVKQEAVSIQLGHRSGIYDLEDFSVIWFRRGKFINSVKPVNNALYPEDEILNNQINKHLQREINELNNFVYQHIPNQVTRINNPGKYNINKLTCLYEAAKIGLKIPDTLITRTIDKVARTKERTALITKNIGDILICHNSHFFAMQGTVLVDKDKIEKSTPFFQPSLFQEAVNKAADIRVFFLFDKVFAAAIINQDETLIDFRSAKEDIVCNYDLPQEVEEQLLRLAKIMGLESGSADFVLSQEGNLFFLEINPVGQVDFVSYQANLYIEKEIAQQLMTCANETNNKAVAYQ